MYFPYHLHPNSNTPQNSNEQANTLHEAGPSARQSQSGPQSIRSAFDLRSRSHTLGRSASNTLSIINNPTNRYSEAQKNADREWVYVQIENYLKSSMVENFPRQIRTTRNILDKFIKKIQSRYLLNPLNHDDAGMSRDAYLSQVRNHIDHGINHYKDSTLELRLNELHDVLFASDLIQILPRYQGFCRQFDVKDSPISMVRKLLDINRVLLDADAGDSLLNRCKKIAEARQNSHDEAKDLTKQLELDAVRSNSERKYLRLFVNFYLRGPENYSPPEPLARDMSSDIFAAQESRRIASIASDAARRLALRNKFYDNEGNAKIHLSAIEVHRDQELLQIRCAGQRNGAGPFYQEVNMNADTITHAIGPFLNSILDFDLHPLLITRQEYQKEAEQTVIDFQGTASEGLPPDDPRFVSAVLLRMAASVKSVTPEAFQDLTSHVAAEQLDQPDKILATDTARLKYYYELVGVPVIDIQLSRSRMNRLDWDFLHAMIRRTEDSFSRIMIGHRPPIEPKSRFVVIRRDRIKRRSLLIDCTRNNQPERRVSRFIDELTKQKRIDNLVLILPAELEAGNDMEAVHNGFFEYYRTVTAQSWFSDGVDALSAFVGRPVSAILLDEHRRPRPEGHIDERDGPVFDYRDKETQLDLADMAKFINESAALPAVPGEETPEVADLRTIPSRIWEETEQFIALLNAWRQQSRGNRIMLGGWPASPYFVVAEYGAAEEGTAPDWHIQHRQHQGQTLANFLLQLKTHLADSSRIELSTLEVDLLTLQDRYCLPQHQTSMGERVSQWSAQRMTWMVQSVQQRAPQLPEALHVSRQDSESIDEALSIATPRSNLDRPHLDDSRVYSSRSENILSRIIAGLPPSYPHRNSRPIEHARISRQHADPNNLHFKKGFMLSFLQRADVELTVAPKTADAILDRLHEEALTDPRYAYFQESQHLIHVLQRFISTENETSEFKGQVIYFVARIDSTDMSDEDQPRDVTLELPMLVKMHAENIKLPQKRVVIKDMLPASQENLVAMIRTDRQWQYRDLAIDEDTTYTSLNRLRSDLLRGINGPVPNELLEQLTDPDAILEKIQQSLLRDDKEAPERITSRLWRVTVKLGAFDIRLLLTKRQNTIRDYQLATPENRALALEQTDNSDDRPLGLINRIAALPNDFLERLRRLLNEIFVEEGLSCAYTDVATAIENLKEEMDELGGEDSPLLSLQIGLSDEETLNLFVLFEDGELVDFREDEEGESTRIKRDMLRLPLDAKLARNLEGLLEEEDNLDTQDTAGQELRDWLIQLKDAAGRFPSGDEENADENNLDPIDKICALIHEGIRRGTGSAIHPDYPDLKKYTLSLKDAAGRITEHPVLIRLKDIDDPQGEDRVREIRPDTEASRKCMLAYQLRRKELDKILTHDKRQNWLNTGHGPLRELAERDYCRQHPDEDVIDLSSLPDPTPAFIRKIVRRNAGIPVPGFPEIARYPTGWRDRAGNMIYLLARVVNSRILDVRLDTGASFMNMALHKGDPGSHLDSVLALLPPGASANDLEAILQPANETSDGIPADYPAYSHFTYHHPAQGSVRFVARLEEKVVTKVSVAERFDELAEYVVPVMFMSSILRADKRNNWFIKNRLGRGQFFWEFVYQHIRRDNKQPLPAYPQLGRHQVTPAPGARHPDDFTLVARVENGDIWQIGEYDPDFDNVLRSMQRAIVRDLRNGPRNVIWSPERALRDHRRLPEAIARIALRQQQLQDPQAVRDMANRANNEIIRKALQRDRYAELARLQLPPEIRPREIENLTALFDGDMAQMMFEINALLNEDGWEPVANHTGDDILRKANGRRDSNGNLLYTYVFMRKDRLGNDRLRDIRFGNADAFETLVRKRREEMDRIKGTDLPHLPLHVVREIWSMDRYMGHGFLMDMADRAQMSFPAWLRSLITPPEIVDGRLVFKTGTPVLDRFGREIELLRRYPTGVVLGGRERQLIGEWETDRQLNEPGVQVTLIDAYIESPRDDADAGYVLSPSLRALCDYRGTGAVDPVGLPAYFDAQAVMTPERDASGSPMHISRRASNESGLFVSQTVSQQSSPGRQSPLQNNENSRAASLPLADANFDDILAAFDFDADPEGGPNFLQHPSFDMPGLESADRSAGGGHHQASPERPENAGLDAVQNREDSADQHLIHGDSLLRELESIEAAPHQLADEDFDAMFAAMDFDADPGGGPNFLRHPSFDTPGLDADRRGSIERMLAEGGIDRFSRHPADTSSTPSDTPPMVYMLNRIDYENPDFVRHFMRFMDDLRDTHGEGIHQRLTETLMPNGNILDMEEGFSYWLSLALQPDREKSASHKHPDMKSFSVGLLGDHCGPVHVLASVRNGLVGIPWIENPKNEKELIKELEEEAKKKKTVFKEKKKPKTALSMKAATILASQLILGDSVLLPFHGELASDSLGSDLLQRIDTDERQNNPALAGMNKVEVFRGFLMRGIRDALTRERSSARLLTIPTKVRDIGGNTLNIKATIHGNTVSRLWAVSEQKRRLAERVNLVEVQRAWDELLRDSPFIKTRKAVRRRQRKDAQQIVDTRMRMSRVNALSRKSTPLSEAHSAPGESDAPDSHDGADHAASETHSAGGSIASWTTGRSMKRRLEALNIAPVSPPLKRQRISQAEETIDAMDVGHPDVAASPGSPMHVDPNPDTRPKQFRFAFDDDTDSGDEGNAEEKKDSDATISRNESPANEGESTAPQARTPPGNVEQASENNAASRQVGKARRIVRIVLKRPPKPERGNEGPIAVSTQVPEDTSRMSPAEDSRRIGISSEEVDDADFEMGSSSGPDSSDDEPLIPKLISRRKRAARQIAAPGENAESASGRSGMPSIAAHSETDKNDDLDSAKAGFEEMVELNSSTPLTTLSKLLGQKSHYINRLRRKDRPASITNEAAYEMNQAIKRLKKKEGQVQYAGEQQSSGNKKIKPKLILPSRKFKFKIIPTPLRYESYKIDKSDTLRQTILQTIQASNLTLNGLMTRLKSLRRGNFENLMSGRTKSNPEIAKQFIDGIESLRKQGWINDDDGSTRISKPDTHPNVVFLPQDFYLRLVQEMELVAENESASAQAVEDPRWAEKFGEEDDSNEEHFSAKKALARFTHVIKLNEHLEEEQICKLLGMKKGFIARICGDDKGRILNFHARQINLAFLALSAKQQVVYEKSETEKAETPVNSVDIDGKLRWPSPYFRIIPHPIELDDQDEENNPLASEVIRFARDNNLGYAGLETLLGLPKNSLRPAMRGKRKKLPPNTVIEMNQAFLNLPMKRFIVGRTRMQHPIAADDIIFIRKGFRGIPTGVTHPKTNKKNENHVQDISQSRFQPIIDLNVNPDSNPPVTLATLSSLLKQSRTYIPSITRKTDPVAITNERAYLMNAAIAGLDEGEVRYIKEQPSAATKSIKPKLRLPSRDYKIIPKPLQYDDYNVDKDDGLRQMMLQIAQASNLTFHALGARLNLPNPRAIDQLMSRVIKSLSSENWNQFVNGMESLRKRGKIRKDGSTRISAPETSPDVIFLPKGFSFSLFKKMEPISESKPDTERPGMIVVDSSSPLTSAHPSEPEENSDEEQDNNAMNDLSRTGNEPVPDSDSHEPATILTRSGRRVARPVIESFEWPESDEKAVIKKSAPKSKKNSGDVHDGAKAGVEKMIDLNRGSITQERLSVLLGQREDYLSNITRNTDAKSILNTHAYDMNVSLAKLATSEEFEIRYADEPSSSSYTSTKAILWLPSADYRIFPTALRFDQYEIDEDDELRQTLLHIAQASNLGFHELGKRLKLSARRTLDQLMKDKDKKRSLSSQSKREFIKGIKSLKEQRKIRDDGSTRLTEPDTEPDVIFLPKKWNLVVEIFRE